MTEACPKGYAGMVIELTERAREVIGRAHQAAVRLNPEARIRLMLTGSTLTPVLTDAPEPEDTDVHLGEAVIFVQAGIDGVVDVEDPHDKLVLRR